jgi:hypothetical protein
MNMRSSKSRWPAVAGGVLVGAMASVSSSARWASAQESGAPTRQECVSLHEKGQELRKQSKLLQTRKILRTCSNESCPGLIREDCTSWLEELERAMPSIAFEIVLDGKDIAEAKITEGDRVLTENIGGTSYEMDPGVHKFKAEIAGHDPIETAVVVREGEKNRVIRIDFTPPPVFGGPLVPPPPTGPRPVPAATWVFGSLALVAAGTGGVLGGLALSKKSDLDKLGCKPFCTDSQLSSTKTMALAADATFAGAVVLAGVSMVFYLTRPVVPIKEKKEIGLEPSAFIGPGYQGIGLRGSF